MTGMKLYKCEYYSVMAAENSCFFCQHCSDILFDSTIGPYGFICTEGVPTSAGLKGRCNLFKEDNP